MKPFAFFFGRKSYKTPRISKLYLKLRSKFTAFFFLMVMLPFLAFITAAYFYSMSALVKNTYEMSLLNLEQEKNSISGYLKDLSAPVASLSGDAYLTGLLQQGRSPASSDKADAKLAQIASDHFTAGQLEKLAAVYIIQKDEIIASYDRKNEKAAINNPSSQDWYKKALASPSEIRILGTTQRFYSEGRSATVFALAKGFEEAQYGSNPAVLLLDFDFDLLSGIAEPGVGFDYREDRLIVDENGKVLYSKDPDMLTISLDEGLLSRVQNARGSGRTVYRGQNVYMTYARFPELPWTFISMIPAAEVTERLIPSANPLLWICIVAIPLILLFYLFASSRFLNPINELTSVISDYEKGNFSDSQGDLSMQKAYLAGGGMENASEIDYLINKINNIKLKQKEAELNSLQNQINPHFLYNTLESIRGAALYHGIHDIAAMSKALSLLFRYSISERVLVSIKEEIQHLDNYMSIQNFRYENKFDLLYSIPPELYNHKILKLTLQPLIENSIKHGLEMKLGRGLIKVEILSLDSNIKIHISDDGLGILPKKIEELNRALLKDENPVAAEGDRTGTGIGVRNVNSRIKLYFGEQYGLKFREALVGTVVEITLPAVKET